MTGAASEILLYAFIRCGIIIASKSASYLYEWAWNYAVFTPRTLIRCVYLISGRYDFDLIYSCFPANHCPKARVLLEGVIMHWEIPVDGQENRRLVPGFKYLSNNARHQHIVTSWLEVNDAVAVSCFRWGKVFTLDFKVSLFTHCLWMAWYEHNQYPMYVILKFDFLRPAWLTLVIFFQSIHVMA